MDFAKSGALAKRVVELEEVQRPVQVSSSLAELARFVSFCSHSDEGIDKSKNEYCKKERQTTRPSVSTFADVCRGLF